MGSNPIHRTIEIVKYCMIYDYKLYSGHQLMDEIFQDIEKILANVDLSSFEREILSDYEIGDRQSWYLLKSNVESTEMLTDKEEDINTFDRPKDSVDDYHWFYVKLYNDPDYIHPYAQTVFSDVIEKIKKLPGIYDAGVHILNENKNLPAHADYGPNEGYNVVMVPKINPPAKVYIGDTLAEDPKFLFDASILHRVDNPHTQKYTVFAIKVKQHTVILPL